MARNSLALVLSILLATAVGQLRAEDAGVIAIGHADTPDFIDRGTLLKVFLGKKTRWNDGSRAVAATLKRGDTLDHFVQEFLGQSIQEFTTYWKRMIFTGRGIPPKSFRSEEQLIEFVQDTPGAVGFVRESTPHDDVKVIAIH